jgi:hypothetical protein
MNSIAVWSNNNNEFKFHLDLNLWVTKKEDDNYIEFGIKLLNTNVDYISLYLPFKINESDFLDMVESLSKDSMLVNAMFNKKLSVENLNGSFCNVKENGELIFCFCQLSEGDYKIINKDNGTQVNIKINKTNAECNKLYYRFRIKKLENIFDRVNANWVFTNGVKENINFIEVSINSVRKLPPSIVDKIQNVKIYSMNIFVITENFVDLLFYSKKIHKSRVLEKLWQDYVDIQNANNINKLVAYHWKNEENDFVDYNLFVKISYALKNGWLLAGMLLFILLIGAIGGVGGNYLTEYIHSPHNKTKEVSKNKMGEHNVAISNSKK